jgi:hypothetical protein
LICLYHFLITSPSADDKKPSISKYFNRDTQFSHFTYEMLYVCTHMLRPVRGSAVSARYFDPQCGGGG